MQIENNRYAYLETDCDLEFDSDYQRLTQDLACLDQTMKMTNDLIKTIKKLKNIYGNVNEVSPKLIENNNTVKANPETIDPK